MNAVEETPARFRPHTVRSGFAALLAAAVLLLSLTAEANEITIGTIELSHRSASALIETIRPLLKDDEAVSQDRSLLILRARPSTIESIRALVAGIDTPLQRLRIEVRWGDAVDDRTTHRITTRRDELTHAIRVIEGEGALIHAGSARLWPDIVLMRDGEVAAAGFSWKEIGSGFYVLPAPVGDRIRLEIEPVREVESRDGIGKIVTGAARTVVEVDPGEWVEIGAVTAEREVEGRRIIATTRDRREEGSRIFVRVSVD